VEAGCEIRVQPRVIAEVAKSQMGQMHAEKMECGRRDGEFFSRGNRFRWRVQKETDLFTSLLLACLAGQKPERFHHEQQRGTARAATGQLRYRATPSRPGRALGFGESRQG
jgi:hypothetical protein